MKNETNYSLKKIISLNSFAIAIKIASGFVVSKMLAIYVGPSGMALVGNFRNFFTVLENITTLGFSNGIVKLLNENQTNFTKQKQVIQTVLFLAVILVLVISFIGVLNIDSINTYVFQDAFYSKKVFYIAFLLFPFYIFSIYFTAFLNGFNRQKELLIISIFGSIFGLLLTVVLLYFFTIHGALLASIATAIFTFLIGGFYLVYKLNFLQYLKNYQIKYAIIKDFSQYSIMFLVSAILSPMVALQIRKNITNFSGIVNAGNWEALSRISSYYFIFITTLLSLYFLPKLSKRNNAENKLAITEYYSVIIPIFFVGLVLVYIAKDWIISVLLTKEFIGIKPLFFWQLVGDFFKACSFIFAYLLIAKMQTKMYVFFEIVSLAILYFSSLFLIKNYQVTGALIAYATTYFVYFVMLCVYYFINKNKLLGNL